MLKKSTSQRIQSFVRKSFAFISLVALLGSGSAILAVPQPRKPQVTHPITDRLNLYITHKVDETYPKMVQRAESLAKVAVDQTFTKNQSVTDVAVMVMAENQGFITPIMSLKVSRQAWKNHPAPQRWATYYSDAKRLLGFTDNGISTSQTATPTTPLLPNQAPIIPTPIPTPSGTTTTTPILPPATPTSPPAITPTPNSLPATPTPNSLPATPTPVPTTVPSPSP